MKKLLFVLLLLPAVGLAKNKDPKEGGTVENGGDTVFCWNDDGTFPTPPGVYPPGEIPDHARLYSRDYVLAIRDGAMPRDFAQFGSTEEDLARIADIIGKISGGLTSSFTGFRHSLAQVQLEGLNSPRPIRRWVRTKKANIGIEEGDELPDSCYWRVERIVDGTKFTVKVRAYERSIVRTETMYDSVLYRYKADSLRRLVENSPLQLSFIFVHEWLWDHTNNPEVNRKVNAFLHSLRIDSMPPREIRRELIRLGFRPPA